MRRSLLKLNERNLPKALRQALVLITMLLLPSAAWGTVYTTSSYEASSSTIGTWNTDQASYSWYAAGSSEKSNDGGLKITIPTNSTLNTMLTLRKPDGSSTEYVTGIQINYSGDNKPTLHNLKVANIDIINQGESVTSQNPWTGNVSNGQFTFNSSIEWNAGQEIIIEYNDGVAYEESQKDFTITSIVVTTTESISYALWIGGTKFTSANLSSIASEKTDSVTSGSITFDPNNSVLTLNNATILSSITSGLSSLTIKLVGNNTVNSAASNGQSGDNYAIYSNNQNATLTIVRDEANADTELNLYGRYTYSIIGGFASVSYGEEGYQTYLSSPYMPAGYNPDRKQMIGYNTNGDYITSASISSAVTYPIWVYNTSTQKYTQLTATASTYTTPEADVDENHKGSVLYSENILSLDNFFCKTTKDDDYVFYIGGNLTNLTVDLVGTNETFYKCFNYLKPTDGEDLQLTYTTSSNGSLEFTGGPTYNNVDCAYKDGLDYFSNIISTDWPRLMIGSTPVRGTGSVDGYSNISYNDDKKTLTLSGTTIGTTGTTNTDIDVYLDDLTVEISGTNTIYGRFCGKYSENGSYAGKINFKNADFANASLIISGKGDGQGPITEFSECKLDEKIKITEAKVDGTSVNVDVLTYANGNYVDGSGNVLAEITLSYQAPQLTVAGIEPDENGVISGDGISSGTVTFTPADDTVSPAQPATLTLEGATIDGYISSSIESLTVYLKGSSTINVGTGISPFQYFKATESSPSTGSLTFNSSDEDKGELTMNGIHESANISSGYSTSPTFTSYSTATGYEGWIKKEYYYIDEPGNQNVVIYKNINYDLWIGGTRITKDNVCPHSGGPTYDIENERLSVSGSCNYSIESSMDNLVIMLSDNAIINGSISTHEGATGELTFIGNDEPEQTTKMFSINNGDEAAISGFSDITYEGFIILSDGAKYDKDEKKLVDASGSAMTRATFASSVELTKPSLTTSQDESVVTVTLSNDNKTTIKPNSEDQTTFYDITYGTLKYSIDYVDGSTGVTDATYDSDNKPTMSKPGTLTAYVYLNGETSETSTGKYFGAKQEVFTVAIGDKIEGTSWFTPEIKADDQIESEFMTQEVDESGIFEREGEGSELYLVAKKSGTTTVNASLWCEEGLTVLNSNIALTFNVGESLSSVFEGENTYGAIYSETAIQVPEGMTAYVITGIDEETGTVKTESVDFIPARTAILLKKGTDAIAMTHVPYTGTKTAPTNNKLNYSDPNSPAKPSTTDNWYVLYNNKFVKVTTNTEVKGGKCYLNLNGTAAGTRGFYNIGNGEGTTAIREVKNGEVKGENWADGEWFDLQGRRLSAKPNKSGLYILNGKKIVVK